MRCWEFGVFSVADRNVVGKRVSADNDAGGMDAGIADRAFELFSPLDNAAGIFIAVDHAFKLVIFFKSFLKRDVEIFGNELADLIHFTQRNI